MIAVLIGMMLLPPSAPQNPIIDRIDRIQVDYVQRDPNRHKVSVWRGTWKTSMIVYSLQGEPGDEQILVEAQGDWRKADNTPVQAISKLYIRSEGAMAFVRFEVYDAVQLHKRIFYIPETPVLIGLDIQ